MGWAVGYDSSWARDIGYGVPSLCDQPDCAEEIDRGLSYVCGGEPYGGEQGCGLYFCGDHLLFGDKEPMTCEPCLDGREPFDPKPDVEKWINHKMTDPSWAQWRADNSLYVTTRLLK